jgi:predicted transcriptional regulator
MVHAHELMRTDFILADVDDTVAALIGQMELHQQREAVVLDGTTYRGVVAKKWLQSSRIDPERMKIKNIIAHRSKSKTPFFVPKLAPETELKEIARLLATADVHALPVIVSEHKKEKVVGMVHAIDVLEAVRPLYTRVRANEIASMKIVTIQQDEALGKALNLMNKQGVGHIIVVNGMNKLVGILGLTDILIDVHAFPRSTLRVPKAASHQKGKHTGFGVGEKTDQLKLPVHNILTHVPNCCTVAPTDSVATVIDEMIESHVGSVVLTTKDVPVGIITSKDILEDYAKP